MATIHHQAVIFPFHRCNCTGQKDGLIGWSFLLEQSIPKGHLRRPARSEEALLGQGELCQLNGVLHHAGQGGHVLGTCCKMEPNKKRGERTSMRTSNMRFVCLRSLKCDFLLKNGGKIASNIGRWNWETWCFSAERMLWYCGKPNLLIHHPSLVGSWWHGVYHIIREMWCIYTWCCTWS